MAICCNKKIDVGQYYHSRHDPIIQMSRELISCPLAEKCGRQMLSSRLPALTDSEQVRASQRKSEKVRHWSSHPSIKCIKRLSLSCFHTCVLTMTSLSPDSLLPRDDTGGVRSQSGHVGGVTPGTSTRRGSKSSYLAWCARTHLITHAS